jgi:hypothetical protein
VREHEQSGCEQHATRYGTCSLRSKISAYHLSERVCSGSSSLLLSTAMSAESASERTRSQSIGVWGIASRREGNHSAFPDGPASQSGCSDAEAELIATTKPGLHDVHSLLFALNVTSKTCRRCILSTVASVCGDNCAREHLHLTLDEPIDAAACVLPGLSSILSAGQALELASAMRSQEPFGLSVALPARSETNPNVTVLVHDLFLPTNETLHDQPVLRGIDTSHRIALCSLKRTFGLVGHLVIRRSQLLGKV